MADTITITAGTREEKYRQLIPQVESLLSNEKDLIAGMANFSAAVKAAMDFLWVGFYFVKGDELVLGPFQGSVACARIAKGKGVCGKAWAENKTVIVPDVDQFPGHIACSSLSKSEIVVPVKDESGVVKAVLDIDSVNLNDFDRVDDACLNKMLEVFRNKL